MSPGILGKKIGMTQMFREDGQAVPVTLLKTGPCMVVQRKTPTTDGYDAVQLGLLEFVKPQRINKPLTGHLKKAGVEHTSPPPGAGLGGERGRRSNLKTPRTTTPPPPGPKKGGGGGAPRVGA